MAGKYVPGIYAADAMGIGGDVSVQVKVDQNQILAVNLDVSSESFALGQAAGPTLVKEILQKQSAGIDAVSGATVTSTAVKKAAHAALKKAQKGKQPFAKLFDTLVGGKPSCQVEIMVKDGSPFKGTELGN